MKSISHFFELRIIRTIISALLIAGTVFSIFRPDLEIFRLFSNYTVHYMILTLLAGLFFLVFNNRGLMLLAFLCCGILCVFLKNRANSSIRLATDSSQPEISIAQVNLTNAGEDYKGLLRILGRDSIDIICFQEVTPDWSKLLTETFSDSFKHIHEIVRIDPYGQMVFSKFAISDQDTFFFENIPGLRTNLQINEDFNLELINFHPAPVVSDESNNKFIRHLAFISQLIQNSTMALFTIGDFNIVPWADEIQQFKFTSDLMDCRREFVPASPFKPFSMNKLPVEHILYNDQLECVSFSNLQSEETDYLGIKGKYQLKEDTESN